MINARYDEEFVFQDGTRAKNILELVLKLERIDNAEFYRFVNSTKNDFANWISAVLNDTNLAAQLRSVITREETMRLIKSRINELSTDIIALNSKPRMTKDIVASTIAVNGVASNNPIQLLSQSAIHVSSSNISQNNTSSVASDALLSNSQSSSHILPSDSSRDIGEHVISSDHGNVSKELKASRNWFKLLLKKDSFKKRLDSIQSDTNISNSTPLNNTPSHTEVSSDKVSSDNTPNKTVLNKDSRYRHLFKRKILHRNLNDEHGGNLVSTNPKEIENEEKESLLWMILYVVLILLIVILLIYKLFLS